MTLHRLYEILLEISTQMTTLNADELLERVLLRGITLLDAHGGVLMLYQPETHRLTVVNAVGSISHFAGADMPADEGLSGRVLQTRRSHAVDDYLRWEQCRPMPASNASHIRAALGIPLLVNDAVIGVINIVRDTPFDEQSVWLGQMFAAQVAVMIENARLFKLQRHQQEVSTSLREVSLLLTSSLKLDETLHHLIEIAQKLFPQAVGTTVQLLDETTETLQTIAASIQSNNSPQKVVFRPRRGIAGHAVSERRVINVANVAADARFLPSPGAPAYKSLLVAPLLMGDRVWGTLSISAMEANAFDTEDEQLADLLARQAAAAIENTLLVEKVRHHADELEQRVNERTLELEHAKERVETILFNNTDGIALLNEDGSIEQTNPAFDRMFGFEIGVDQTFGKPFLETVHPHYRALLQAALNNVKESRAAQRVELDMCRQDGTSFAADMVLYTIEPHRKYPMNIVCSLRDVTERRELEQNLLEALEKEKLLGELKSRFASMVSHNFRTPLAIILSSADMLMRYSPRLTEDKKQQQLFKIQGQVRNLTTMLDDILMISRAQTVGLEVRPNTIHLESFCRELVEELRAAHGREEDVYFEAHSGCGTAFLDERLLNQAVANLLSNAIKYTPVGRKIRVTLYCESTGFALSIQDEGIGIPAADLERIYDPFHRGNNVGVLPGTGLGLAITHQAVQAHGGSIEVSSTVGVGTRFTIHMPLRIPEAEPLRGQGD